MQEQISRLVTRSDTVTSTLGGVWRGTLTRAMHANTQASGFVYDSLAGLSIIQSPVHPHPGWQWHAQRLLSANSWKLADRSVGLSRSSCCFERSSEWIFMSLLGAEHVLLFYTAPISIMYGQVHVSTPHCSTEGCETILSLHNFYSRLLLWQITSQGLLTIFQKLLNDHGFYQLVFNPADDHRTHHHFFFLDHSL